MSNEIGEFIRRKRKEAKMTLKQVSEGAGISFPYLSTLETGKRENPSAEVLNNIAGVLGIQPVEILTVAGYLAPTDMDKVAEKEKDYLQFNRFNPLEILTKVKPDVLKNIFKSYINIVDLKASDYKVLNVSEEFLKKITPKEYVDLLIINHKELLHIYVFLAATSEISGNNIPASTIWRWAENPKKNENIIEKEIDFAAFGIWYKLYFFNKILDEYGNYELRNSIDYSFDITQLMENDTILFQGKILSPRVVKSIRIFLENTQ